MGYWVTGVTIAIMMHLGLSVEIYFMATFYLCNVKDRLANSPTVDRQPTPNTNHSFCAGGHHEHIVDKNSALHDSKHSRDLRPSEWGDMSQLAASTAVGFCRIASALSQSDPLLLLLLLLDAQV